MTSKLVVENWIRAIARAVTRWSVWRARVNAFITRTDYDRFWYRDCGCGPKEPCANGPSGRDWQRFLS